MNEIIWIHDKALKKNYIKLKFLTDETKVIFIWDDNYFRKRFYSLKRLVFIYETLCQMSITIIYGDIFQVLSRFSPAKVRTFFTTDTKINEIILSLRKNYEVEVIPPKPFVQIPSSCGFKRFFNYWGEAKMSAFIKDGRIHD